MHELAVHREALPANLEVGTLARELAATFRSLVSHHKDQLGLSNQEAAAMAEEPSSPEDEQSMLSVPADQVPWVTLHALAQKDPEKALRLWNRMKGEALDELQSGHRAARVMEGCQSDAWGRAQFLAIRQDLLDAWQPRNGVERQLIDAMAQAQTAMFFWQGVPSIRASAELKREEFDIRESGGWGPPRVLEHQAVEQAAAMVDRFSRIHLRTLRALCNLRKVPLAVVVQNADQVNIGGQQVNTHNGEARRTVRAPAACTR